jgi:peptidase E
VAFGGGVFSMEWGNTLLDDRVLSLTGVDRPRVCFLPTASGDADHYVVRFYRAFSAARCAPSHISSRRGARTVFVRQDGERAMLERELPVRYLGDPPSRPEPSVLAA